jgi:aminopeptidase YwaD
MALRRVDKQMVDDTLDFTRSLLDKHGPRPTGTRSCLSAADDIADALRQTCDSVQQESFTLHPGAVFMMGRIVALSYIAAAILLVLGGAFSYAAAVLCLAVILYVWTGYVRCGTFFDSLFKQVQGCNVTGIIEPAGEVRRQVLIAGHHDSPYIFNFLAHYEKWAGLRFLLGAVSYLYIAVVSIAGSIFNLFYGIWALRGIGLVIAIAGLVFAFPLYFFISRKPSPGAGDNLNASSMAVQIARFFAAQRDAGRPLQHTRLIALSTDGEEAGQKGALAYATRHLDELKSIPSYVLAVDSVYRRRDLMLITSDQHGTTPLSPDMTRECYAIATELDIPIQRKALPLGGGGTDAAVFAKAGIAAASLIGVSTSMMCEGHIYHTEQDTVEAIEPAAVEAVLEIAVNYILQKDAE